MKQDCKKYDGCRKPVQQCNAKCSEYSPRGIDYGDCPFAVWGKDDVAKLIERLSLCLSNVKDETQDD